MCKHKKHVNKKMQELFCAIYADGMLLAFL